MIVCGDLFQLSLVNSLAVYYQINDIYRYPNDDSRAGLKAMLRDDLSEKIVGFRLKELMLHLKSQRNLLSLSEQSFP